MIETMEASVSEDAVMSEEAGQLELRSSGRSSTVCVVLRGSSLR